MWCWIAGTRSSAWFPTSRRIVTLDVERVSRVYHAAAFGDFYPGDACRARARQRSGDVSPARFRELSAAVDPNLQLRDVATLDDAMKREQGLMRLIGCHRDRWSC